MKGNSIDDLFGRWVSTAGDINGDGFPDIMIGACDHDNSRGALYVIYGGPNPSLSNIDLSSTSLDPSITGFTITGENTGDQLGISGSTARDINNDGYDDIIIGASGYNSSRGAAYVIYGGPKSSLSNINLGSLTLNPTTTGFMIKGSSPYDILGWPVVSGGDINGDGFPDIMIGAYGHDNSRGALYVIYGGSNPSLSNIDLSSTTLDPLTTGFTLTGDAAGDQLGFSANAGDFNNDGYNDIIIGAPNKNNASGIAYVIHATCPIAHCDSCLSRECQTCNQGYGLLNSQCEICPSNCYRCTLSSICEECTSPYLLYQSWCLPDCPTGTYSSNNTCQKCPVLCSSCSSQESCQTCGEGFVLSDSLCVLPPASSYPKTEAAATQAVSSSVRGISSVVNVGSATSPLTAVVSKIVQNTRYLNISVTLELTEVYKTWNTDLISWQVPDAIASLDYKESPSESFAQYGLESSFLANFWAALMTITLTLVILIALLGLRMVLDTTKYNNWLTSLVKKLIAGSFNFALVQAYGCFDDILFYLVLDTKTNPFNTFFSWVSLICAVAFLALGCFLVFLNIWKVKQYQKIKSQATEIEAFNERNRRWELFYSDFNDSDLWTQSTLALLIVRSSFSSLIITTLYEYPLMQTGFLIILDGAILLFLFFQNPFKTLRGKLAQYYFEAITLLVHLCTLTLAMQDTFPNPSHTLRDFLSTSIIYLNTALVSGSITFLGIEIYKTISQRQREGKKLENNNVREDSQKIRRFLPHPKPTKRIHPERDIDSHRKLKFANNEQDLPREHTHILPDFTQNPHVSFTETDLQSSNDYNLTMNTEELMISDMDSSVRIRHSLPQNSQFQFKSRQKRPQRQISQAGNPKRQIKNIGQIV